MRPTLEKLPFRFDIEKMRSQLFDEIIHLEPAFSRSAFHGWSFLSSDGDYKDGFNAINRAYENDKGEVQNSFNVEKALKLGWRPDESYTKPTQIYRGYFKEVMDQIIAWGFQPTRARISCLPPGFSTSYHRDAPDGKYWIRMHIPIDTNPDALFITDSESLHLVADGSAYLVNVAQMHRAFNGGTKNRYHLIMQAWDTQHLSKHFKYDFK